MLLSTILAALAQRSQRETIPLHTSCSCAIFSNDWLRRPVVFSLGTLTGVKAKHPKLVRLDADQRSNQAHVLTASLHS